MKTRLTHTLLLGLLTALLLITLSGCSILPSHSPPQDPAPAALELHLGSALPEDAVLTWDPASVAVEQVEVTVSGPEPSRTVTVTIQLCPLQP